MTIPFHAGNIITAIYNSKDNTLRFKTTDQEVKLQQDNPERTPTSALRIDEDLKYEDPDCYEEKDPNIIYDSKEIVGDNIHPFITVYSSEAKAKLLDIRYYQTERVETKLFKEQYNKLLEEKVQTFIFSEFLSHNHVTQEAKLIAKDTEIMKLKDMLKVMEDEAKEKIDELQKKLQRDASDAKSNVNRIQQDYDAKITSKDFEIEKLANDLQNAMRKNHSNQESLRKLRSDLEEERKQNVANRNTLQQEYVQK